MTGWIFWTVPTILMLGLTIAWHEYGHYFFMRRNGVRVEEFTVGFGPTLCEKKLASGTMFRIKAILVGGYVKPAEDEGAGSLAAVSRWAKFKILLGGVLFNAIASFVAFAVVFYATGESPAGVGMVGLFDGLSGPVGLLKLFALLNMALAVMNLLPLFPLDGGHIVTDVLLARVKGRTGELP